MLASASPSAGCPKSVVRAAPASTPSVGRPSGSPADSTDRSTATGTGACAPYAGTDAKHVSAPQSPTTHTPHHRDAVALIDGEPSPPTFPRVPTAEPLYALRAVGKSFGGRPALTDVTLDVHRGDKLALVGTSGAGKSTLLRLLNRLEAPDTGDILLAGRPLAEHDPVALRRRTGYVIQRFGLLPHWSVGRNVATVPELLGWPPAERAARTAELLAALRLPPHAAHRRPHTLSGGQQQRVGLARALAARPSVLLVDEPFGALDPVTRRAIRADLAALPEWPATTVVLVTHSVEEAFAVCTRVAVMDAGRVVQLGTPAELLARPASAFVRDLVGAAGRPAYADYLASLAAA